MLVAGVLGLAGGLGLFALRGRAMEPVLETGTTLMMSVLGILRPPTVTTVAPPCWLTAVTMPVLVLVAVAGRLVPMSLAAVTLSV